MSASVNNVLDVLLDVLVREDIFVSKLSRERVTVIPTHYYGLLFKSGCFCVNSTLSNGAPEEIRNPDP
jgi:hypothetical protein